MTNYRLSIAIAVVSLLTGVASAQTYHYSPAGHDVLEGNDDAQIPWNTLSATYQQVHDASDLARSFGGLTTTITSINFRKDGSPWWSTRPLVGRSIYAQVTLATGGSSTSPSSTFALNLGGAPQLVLPYTTINFPSVLSNASSLPNPISWSIPFATPYTYVATAGNLCWELRFRNNTNATLGSHCDATNPVTSQSSELLGTGCIATGHYLPARISSDLSRYRSDWYGWSNILFLGAPSAPTVLLAGFHPNPIPLPGFCSNLEFTPVASISGVTDATGRWNNTANFRLPMGIPQTNILGQFAFIDGGLPNGVGLSPASSIVTVPQNNYLHSRIWIGSEVWNGYNTALTGSVDSGRVFVTAFGQ